MPNALKKKIQSHQHTHKKTTKTKQKKKKLKQQQTASLFHSFVLQLLMNEFFPSCFLFFIWFIYFLLRTDSY